MIGQRQIPAVIMEPLLGRLSKLNDHLVARLKQRRPGELMWHRGHSILQYVSQYVVCAEWNDIWNICRITFGLILIEPLNEGGKRVLGRNSPIDAEVPYDSLQ